MRDMNQFCYEFENCATGTINKSTCIREGIFNEKTYVELLFY